MCQPQTKKPNVKYIKLLLLKASWSASPAVCLSSIIPPTTSFGVVKKKANNKPIKINSKVRHEKLYRNDKKYDLLIPIEYNSKRPKKNKGSAIFLHLTSNYKKTQGCVAIKEKDMLILLKLINKKTKIKII